MERERLRYRLKEDRLLAHLQDGEVPEYDGRSRRKWWELAVLCAALGIFVWLATVARPQPLAVNPFWALILIAAALAFLVGTGLLLWRRTRFG